MELIDLLEHVTSTVNESCARKDVVCLFPTEEMNHYGGVKASKDTEQRIRFRRHYLNFGVIAFSLLLNQRMDLNIFELGLTSIGSNMKECVSQIHHTSISSSVLA